MLCNLGLAAKGGGEQTYKEAALAGQYGGPFR